MKPQQLNPEELNLVKLAREYSDEDKARALLESLRWPNGVVCPRCQNDGEAKTISKLEPKDKESKSAVRKGVYFCGACRKQTPRRRQVLRSLRSPSGRSDYFTGGNGEFFISIHPSSTNVPLVVIITKQSYFHTCPVCVSSLNTV